MSIVFVKIKSLCCSQAFLRPNLVNRIGKLSGLSLIAIEIDQNSSCFVEWNIISIMHPYSFRPKKKPLRCQSMRYSVCITFICCDISKTDTLAKLIKSQYLTKLQICALIDTLNSTGVTNFFADINSRCEEMRRN